MAPAREPERERGRAAAADLAETRSPRSASRARDGRVKASPLARRIARERGIELALAARHRPRGPDRRRGRRARRERLRPRRRRPRRSSRRPARSQRIPLSNVRKTIARRLTAAWQAPVFQISMSADMSAAQSLREKLVARARRRRPADGHRRAHEGLRGRAAAPPGRERALGRGRDRAAPARERRARGRDRRRPRRAGDPAGRAAPDRGDRGRPQATSSPARARGGSGRRISPAARSRSRTSACTASRPSSPCSTRPRRRSSRPARSRTTVVVEDEEWEVRPLMSMTLTCDHRALDGATARRVPPGSEGASRGARADAVKRSRRDRLVPRPRPRRGARLLQGDARLHRGVRRLGRPLGAARAERLRARDRRGRAGGGGRRRDASTSTTSRPRRSGCATSGPTSASCSSCTSEMRLVDVFDPDGNRIQLTQEV